MKERKKKERLLFWGQIDGKIAGSEADVSGGRRRDTRFGSTCKRLDGGVEERRSRREVLRVVFLPLSDDGVTRGERWRKEWKL